ncbi:MAG TPA: lamin tail domain-containing protein [Bacteroidia bacterium]|jgi:hypothetical protein|nr:lamin tail domain-containing protein [Bacteroidia bacterium]
MKTTHFKILTFTFLLAAKLYAQVPGDIIISEFMPDPAKVADGSGEWLEIYNTTNHVIDVNGWHINDGKTKNHVIKNGDVLLVKPNGFLLFTIKSDSTLNGGIVPDYVYSTVTFANTTGKINITDASGAIIDSVAYSSTAPGKSWSLDPQHFNASDNDNPSNWCAGKTTYGAGDFGTPKKMNASCIATAVSQPDEKSNFIVQARSGELSILLTDMLEKQKWEIIDITGRIIQAGTIPESTNNFSIPLNKNERGIYFFRLYKLGITVKFIIE